MHKKSMIMKITGNTLHIYLLVTIALLLFAGCVKKTAIIESGPLRISLNNEMNTLITIRDSLVRPYMSEFQPSEYLVTTHDTFSDFRLNTVMVSGMKDFAGDGKTWIFKGTSYNKLNNLTKILSVRTYEWFPGWAFYEVKYINSGETDIVVKKWVNHSYKINSSMDKPDFWSFQASSTGERKDWVLPVTSGFFQQNYLGMNDPDYGGGIPVLDLWRRDAGIAIGHTAMVPKLVSLPVDMTKDKDAVSINVEYAFTDDNIMHPGDTLTTLETFVCAHHGDYFTTLRQYSHYMQMKGIHFPDPEPLAFEPMWCAWGYMRKFTVDEIIGTLPKVKDLGFVWVTVDDGYQQAEGDWDADLKKFPRGDADMKKLVDVIHSYGFKAQIWWTPMAADPNSKLLAQQPDLILKNPDGSPQRISWWDSYYLSPAYQKTLDHTKAMVEKFIGHWGYDGLKLDGQHLNACPPDYNPLHGFTRPEDAPESVPAFFKLIFNTARQIKPDAVIQLCPCGDAMSFYNIPFTNQFVASDPVGSKQIRSKGKTYKAIAPHTAYFGDHVELSDRGTDFASTVGIGGVPGTKFTWPKDNPYSEESNLLTPEREKEWKRWIALYKIHMLSQSEYLGELYDIGYDKPEAHVIRKADTLFYAFYADDWQGVLSFRGLSQGSYRVFDYVTDRDLGIITYENPKLEASFRNFLLIMVYPDKPLEKKQ
jgi:alpha-galactosidase